MKAKKASLAIMPSKLTNPRRDERKQGKPKERSPRHSPQRISTGKRDMPHDKTKLTSNGKNGVGMKENKSRKQCNKHTAARAPPTCTQPTQEKWVHIQGIQRVWFGERRKRVYFQFPARTSFRKILCWDDILPKRGGRQLRPLDECQKGRQRDTPKPYPFKQRGGLIARSNKKGNLSPNGQWKKENALGIPGSGSGRATNGLVGSLEGVSIANQKQLVKSQG